MQKVQVKAQVGRELRDALERLARGADRSVAAELRRAIREYVAQRSVPDATGCEPEDEELLAERQAS